MLSNRLARSSRILKIRPLIAHRPYYLNFATSSVDKADLPTITDSITHDHREIEDAYNEIVNSTDTDHQTRYQNQFTWELARHSIGEEIVVYPAMEKYMGEEGKAKAEKDRQEHRVVRPSLDLFKLALSPLFSLAQPDSPISFLITPQVKEQLYKFQNLKAGSPEFIPTLKELMANLSQHIKEEEADDLPALEKAIKATDSLNSGDLAKSFDRTKMLVPSRSHPSAPDRPPFETVVGLLATPIDRIGDLLRKFP